MAGTQTGAYRRIRGRSPGDESIDPPVFPEGRALTFTNFGRTAFEGILRSRDLHGATVLFPALFCRDSFEYLLDRYELEPRFADVDPETYHLDFDQARRAASDVDVIVLPHAFGVPARSDRWRRLASAHDALLVEDCARALGASEDGRPVGSVGDFAIYSLKKVSPLSGGGALVGSVDEAVFESPTYDPKDLYPFLPDSLRAALKRGYDAAGGLVARSSGDDAGEGASNPSAPVPRRLDGLNEALFRYHLRGGFDERVRRNVAGARRVRPPLEALGVEFQTVRGRCPYHFLAMAIPDRRDELVDRLRDAGIPVRTFWKEPLVTDFVEPDRFAREYPNAERLTREALQLPLREMSDEDIDRAIGLLAADVASHVP